MPNSTSTQNPTICHLLELPAELRNRIYCDVLVQERPIITTPNFAQPELLRTYRQIRGESRAIYYLEETFQVSTDNFNHRLLKAFCQQMGELWPLNRSEIKIGTKLNHTERSWNNLISWVEGYAKGDVPGMGVCDSCKVHGCCLAAAGEAFRLAFTLRGVP